MAGGDVEILDYAPRHRDAWRALNEAWISRDFTIEAKDRKILDDPEGEVLAGGGRIFMAERGGEPVGCVALLALPDGGFEVAKMTVAEAARGTGLGRRLMQACVEGARAAGAPRLYLESSRKLAPALALYRSVGFREIPARATPYARCDVQMELSLTD